MRQGDLAAALGVSRSAVNAWINDRAWPQASLGALEEILGVRLDGDGSPNLALVGQMDLPEDAKEAVAAVVIDAEDEAARRRAIREAAPGAYRRLVSERDRNGGG